MRNLIFTAIPLALLAAAACVTGMPAGDAGDGQARAPAAVSLDTARAADRQMLAYGEAHPECRLWTNWEKLCSRTGRGGGIECDIDRGRRVAPSLPFCVASRSETPASPAQDTERALRERFCVARTTTENLLDQSLVRVCTRHDPRRPFNGRRIAALLHRGCDSLSDAATGRLYCVRGGNAAARVPDCVRLAAAGREHSGLLQCSSWSGDASCQAFPIRPPPSSDPEAVSFPQDPDRNGVHGLFCENR